jgi:hypothetical protein
MARALDEGVAMSPDQSRHTIFAATTAVVYLVANILIARCRGGWRPLSAVIAAILASCFAFSWYYRDAAMLYYVLFGVVAGFGELPTDAWLVKVSGTLIYPRDEPMIWASPAYMPFAWAVVLMQVCVLGDALASYTGLAAGTVLVALLAGAYIPLFEHLAKDANLWWYRRTPMFFNAPYYVILAEFLLGLPLVWMGFRADDRTLAPGEVIQVVGLGLIEGLAVMFVAVLIAWKLVGRPRSTPAAEA